MAAGEVIRCLNAVFPPFLSVAPFVPLDSMIFSNKPLYNAAKFNTPETPFSLVALGLYVIKTSPLSPVPRPLAFIPWRGLRMQSGKQVIPFYFLCFSHFLWRENP